MFNKVVLIGRISTDLELKTTNSGISKCNFNLAVNRTYTNQDGERETDFIQVVVWKKQAENLVEYRSKGSLIAVEGSIRVDNYVDSEGNNKHLTYVLAQNIQFLDNKNKGSDTNVGSNEPETQEQEEDPFAEFGDSIEISDDDLPFGD